MLSRLCKTSKQLCRSENHLSNILSYQTIDCSDCFFFSQPKRHQLTLAGQDWKILYPLLDKCPTKVKMLPTFCQFCRVIIACFKKMLNTRKKIRTIVQHVHLHGEMHRMYICTAFDTPALFGAYKFRCMTTALHNFAKI
jgi:hypothetical protein